MRLADTDDMLIIPVTDNPGTERVVIPGMAVYDSKHLHLTYYLFKHPT